METQIETQPKEGFKEIYQNKVSQEIAAGVPQAPVMATPPKAEPVLGRQYESLSLEGDTWDSELTLAEVNARIETFMSAASSDPKGHPYVKRGHPLKKNYREYIKSHFELKAELEAESDEPTELEAHVLKQEEKESRAQAVRVIAAKAEIKKLGKLNFDTAEIPTDISEVTYQLLRAERFYAEEDYSKGDEIVREIAKKLKVSSSEMQAHIDLRNISEGADKKKKIADRITLFLNDEHKKQVEALRKTKAEIAHRVANPKKRFRYL